MHTHTKGDSYRWATRMKVKQKTGLLVTLFRILSLMCIALLCDLWFYTHMSVKSNELEQHNRAYWKDYVGREWTVADIRDLFGVPDRTTSNVLTFTAFDFSRSETVFPITEILLSRSLWHIQRHDIEFTYGDNNLIVGYGESQNDGSFRKYEGPDMESQSKKVQAEAHATGIIDADRDFSNGVYRIEVYGLRSISTSNEDRLDKQYKVKTVAVAGCCVSTEVIGHADGYNSRMEELLKRKYGRDIFEESQPTNPPYSSSEAGSK